MPAPRRISDKAIVDALRLWEGNISAVAEELKIARNNLYERISALGLEADLFRGKHNATYQDKPMNGNTEGPRPVTSVRQRDGGIFPSPDRGRIVHGMQTAEAPTAPQVRQKIGPIRLRPDQVQALRDAKFDYQAKHRIEAGEGDLLQRFFDEQFSEWLRRALGREKKA